MYAYNFLTTVSNMRDSFLYSFTARIKIVQIKKYKIDIFTAKNISVQSSLGQLVINKAGIAYVIGVDSMYKGLVCIM